MGPNVGIPAPQQVDRTWLMCSALHQWRAIWKLVVRPAELDPVYGYSVQRVME